MSTYAGLTITIKGLDKDEFGQFIQESFSEDESKDEHWTLADTFGDHVINDWEYYAIGEHTLEPYGQIMTDSDVRWCPFTFLQDLIPLTEKYPNALVHIRVWHGDGDEGDDCNVNYFYVKNGKYFDPEIKVIVEEYSEEKLTPIKGSFYDQRF